MQCQTIRVPGQRPLVLFSDASRPIADLSFRQRALLFAELSLIAYKDEDKARQAGAAIGLPDVTFFDNRGAQAYRFRNRHNAVITCRGTEPHEWSDIRADLNAFWVLAETAGRAHRGFKGEVDNLWPMLETALDGHCQPLYFVGHSLGGAMATICAARCLLSYIAANPQEIFTFGSPRVGDRYYVNFVSLRHHRFVNNNDVVTRVPPVWLGYRHGGHEVYFNRHGEIKDYNCVMKSRDRWRGFFRGLLRGRIDYLADHGIFQYRKHLLYAVRNELRQRASQDPQPRRRQAA